MQALSIFVSSTCCDLRHLRDHFRSEIQALNHEPILSEYPTFPVSPDLINFDNCIKVIRERADILVLIIGGKRGSLDNATGRSIVNLEYREARAIGLDCFIFVDLKVWNLLPHFKRNPGADFAPDVDYPDVFHFIEDIEKEAKWIFNFTHTDEIITTLKNQLSFRFRDLLIRSKNNRLIVPTEFVHEAPHIGRLVLDKDTLWELRLASELLKDRISRLESKFNDLDSGLVVRRIKFLAISETIEYIQNLLSDLMNIVQAAVKILDSQLTSALGTGDAVLIKRACDNLYSLFLSLYEWELDVRFVRLHELFEEIFLRMHGWTSEIFSEFRRIPTEVEKLLFQPGITGEHTIHLIIEPPKGMHEFSEDLQRMLNDPQFMLAFTNGS